MTNAATSSLPSPVKSPTATKSVTETETKAGPPCVPCSNFPFVSCTIRGTSAAPSWYCPFRICLTCSGAAVGVIGIEVASVVETACVSLDGGGAVAGLHPNKNIENSNKNRRLLLEDSQ